MVHWHRFVIATMIGTIMYLQERLYEKKNIIHNLDNFTLKLYQKNIISLKNISIELFF